ncbi:MAG: DegQ family serine endoprotease [Gammaproteobacteria bacterium]|nr:DegQ family serine endoprotease [Gammaproteobacteria bacterium]
MTLISLTKKISKNQYLFSGILIILFSTFFINHLYALPTHDSQNKQLPTLAPMLEKITPAVVNISTKGKLKSRNQNYNQLPDILNDPFFKHFFKFNEPRHQQRPQQQIQALGSGVIVNAQKGYILTNNHVIDNASEILVTLSDGRKLVAELIGTDPQTDIAVLKVNSNNLTEVKFSNSDHLRVGDFTLAIGHPFGLGQTVTSGIVSGLGRSGLGIEAYENFIQTDASINPGNSGGALVNLHGELIGINTAIFSQSGGNIGIGFAIPVNMAKSVMNQLIKHGTIQRGLLGVQVQDLTPELASAFGVDVTEGAIVAQVIPNSAASQAGVKAGDIIIKVNNREINNSSALRNFIGLKRPGESAKLTIIRGKKTLKIKAIIGGEKIISTNKPSTLSPAQTSNGQQLHPALEGAQFAQNGKNKEVQVVNVTQASPAWQAGLRNGDVILAINRKLIHSINDLKKQAIVKQNQAIALNIRRGNSALFLVLR